MHIPGSSRCLFSITKFAQHGHYTVVKWNATTLFFGTQQAPVTILVQGGGDSLAANLRVHKNYEEYHTIPSAQNRDHSNNKKRLSLELLHRQLGHRKCRTLLAASKHQLWQDVAVHMSPEVGHNEPTGCCWPDSILYVCLLSDSG